MDKTDKLINWQDDEKRDGNRDGIDDRLAPEIPDVAAGSRELAERLRENPNVDPSLTGGDIDAAWDMAESQGDEAVSGSNPTPGQNDVEENGRAIGVTYHDDETLRVGEKESDRDKKRWELDPASAEDYKERLKNEG